MNSIFSCKYTYTFNGWSPAVVAVGANVTYKAEFYKTRKNIVVEDDDDETTAPAPETNAPETNAPTTTPTEEKGCGAVVSGSAVLMALIAGGAVALTRKKKED